MRWEAIGELKVKMWYKLFHVFKGSLSLFCGMRIEEKAARSLPHTFISGNLDKDVSGVVGERRSESRFILNV